MKIYIGLDLATVAGFAIWKPEEQTAQVFQTKGTPVEQLHTLRHVLETRKLFGPVFCIEELHHIQNHRTVVQLAERRGFIRYTLMGIGFRVEDVHSESARSLLKTRNKEGTFRKFTEYFKGQMFTDNMADALAVAIFQASRDALRLDWERLSITNLTENEGEPV